MSPARKLMRRRRREDRPAEHRSSDSELIATSTDPAETLNVATPRTMRPLEQRLVLHAVALNADVHSKICSWIRTHGRDPSKVLPDGDTDPVLRELHTEGLVRIEFVPGPTVALWKIAEKGRQTVKRPEWALLSWDVAAQPRYGHPMIDDHDPSYTHTRMANLVRVISDVSDRAWEIAGGAPTPREALRVIGEKMLRGYRGSGESRTAMINTLIQVDRTLIEILQGEQNCVRYAVIAGYIGDPQADLHAGEDIDKVLGSIAGTNYDVVRVADLDKGTFRTATRTWSVTGDPVELGHGSLTST